MRSAQLLLRTAPATKPLHSHAIRCFTITRVRPRAFQEGDVVLLRNKQQSIHEGNLVKLDPSKKTETHKGAISHAEIIGKQPRQVVQSSKGVAYRIHEPTLAEYVRLTPRLVTPIYPYDANLIVSLLDIHVDTPYGPPDGSPSLEILEAGTGHGALTLHLARAIHAGNPPRPRAPIVHNGEHGMEDPVFEGNSLSDLDVYSLDSWKQHRRAIVHTLDISSKHSKHAKKIVQGFRDSMYAGNVDFHVGNVLPWIEQQRTTRGTEEPFLSRVVLDMPNADHQLADVAPALCVNGILAVFNPSITQIVDCVEKIKEQNMPYLLEQVVELGVGTVREWDVRVVRPRAKTPKAEVQNGAEAEPALEGEPADPVEGHEARDGELRPDADEKRAIICRPKAGQMVVGGGFLGLWRRMDKSKPPTEG